MARRILCLFIVFLLIMPVLLHGQEKRKKIIVTKKMLEDFVQISNDEAVFDENDLMKLHDQSGDLIAYYGLFKHPKLEAYNRKIFNKDKELLMTCVYVSSGPLGTDYEIQFKDKDEKIGKIKVKKTIAFGIWYDFEVNYYNEKYSLRYDYIAGFGGITIETFLYNKTNDIVMYWKKEGDAMGKSKSNLYVKKDFMANNRMDVANWTILFFMIY
jgi:hypothetical protein